MLKPKRLIPFVAGPLLFLLISFVPIGTIAYPARMAMALALWMAVWWIFESIPLYATALLPVVFHPLLGVMTIRQSLLSYADPIVYLFFGGFVIAIAVEKWKLHKRIALWIIYQVGTNARRIILGFMIACAFLSMWISNSATALMLLPVGLALISQLNKLSASLGKGLDQNFAKALLLSIAYAASIGGTATLVGSPTNLIFSGNASRMFGDDIAFLDWMLYALPISIVLLVFCWYYLSYWHFKLPSSTIPGSQGLIKKELDQLGKLSAQERRVMIIFALVSFFWISRSFLWQGLLPGLSDTGIAIAGALVLFIWPSGKGQSLLIWEDLKQLPWGVLILFGGGLSIAESFKVSGLDQWLGSQFSYFESWNYFLLLLICIASINFLTEITSNVATAAVFVPIFASLAQAIGVHPYLLMISTSLAASFAFMLPVATPPNAVVFGSKHLSIGDMVRAGLVLNLVSIGLLALANYFYLPIIAFWE